MNCAACERHLSAYIDDEMDAELRLQIEGHLDQCERCRADFESHLAAWEVAQAAAAGSAPEGLWDRIEAGLGQAGSNTSLEDLALMLRGLAGEVQDLRRAVDGLRRELGEEEWERGSEEDIRVRSSVATDRPRPGTIRQLRRTS